MPLPSSRQPIRSRPPDDDVSNHTRRAPASRAFCTSSLTKTHASAPYRAASNRARAWNPLADPLVTATVYRGRGAEGQRGKGAGA